MNETGPAQAAEAWHQRSAADVVSALESGGGGLGHGEAAARLERFGPNRLPEAPRRSAVVRFFLHFHNILIYVLLAAAAITAALDHPIDTGVILAVVVVNAIIGFLQEGKAVRAMDAIRRMLVLRASVLRDGDRQDVDGESVVPGDIVLLQAGDKVPADLRLIQVSGLQMQEAILTGESLPVEKHIRPVPGDVPLGDRACMAFSGTLVTSGMGRGIVVATGERTEIGRISGMLSRIEELKTPLIRQMDVFARWLTGVILLIAAGLLIFGFLVPYLEFTETFMAVVGLAVAAIPEGMPAVLTITLAVGVQAMARRKAIVRRLPAIETLGAVSVICTDKTGTLTRNEMMVAELVTPTHVFSLEGAGYAPEGAITLRDAAVDVRDHAILDELGRAAVLCNDTSLNERAGIWTVEGDPMEGALLALAGKLGIDTRKERAAWARTDAIPFDSRHRFMATLDHDHENHAVVSIKGAPEKIIEMCRAQRGPSGATEPLDRDYWRAQAEQVAAQGRRVLAFAVRPMRPEHTVLEFDDVEAGAVFLGLVGLIDPPRLEAIEAVAECQAAGIRVKMITGDYKGTAVAIGRQIGLLNHHRALTGAEIDAMDDAALAAAVVDADIFARTAPEHKLRLVMALQAHGMTVAMTGDGVNDAPALKRADAGIAMGLTGSEAAKEAAELVLADDNFATIVAAVREGRTVYSNIKKVIGWTLPTNAGEAMTIVLALTFGMTLPITPVQILWVNMITSITLGVALAFEPTEAGVMRRPPRPQNEPLLSGELAWQTVFVSALFTCGVFGMHAYATARGYSIDLARTAALNTLVMMEISLLLFIRNINAESLTWDVVRGTKVLWATISCVVAAQAAITYLPLLQRIFATEALPLFDVMTVIGIGVVLYAVVASEKRLRAAFLRR